MSRSARLRLTWEPKAAILAEYEKQEMAENVLGIRELRSWSKLNLNLTVYLSLFLDSAENSQKKQP